jgi:hypothetical protein
MKISENNAPYDNLFSQTYFESKYNYFWWTFIHYLNSYL